jgi:hypothetical protein
LLFVAGLTLAAAGSDAATLGLVASGYLLCSRVVLRPEMTRAHREGVSLQEQYDVTLFGLSWNRGLAGRQMPVVDTEDLANRYSGPAELLADWYVECGTAPASVRVLIGQLENAAWGRRDHQRFAVTVAAVFSASVAMTVVVGLLRDVSLAVYVSALLAPSLPWLLDLVDATTLHARASAQREEIEADLTELWESLREGPDAEIPGERLRVVQDRIFGVRRSSGRVPTWFYRLYQRRNEQAFAAAAQRMLADKGYLDAD